MTVVAKRGFLGGLCRRLTKSGAVFHVRAGVVSIAVLVLLPTNVMADSASEYARLCREKVGIHVFEKVEGVRGILDTVSEMRCRTCEFALVTSGYEFVEYRVTEKMKRRSFPSHYIESRGLHRFTLEEAHHPNCRLFYKFYAPRATYGRSMPVQYKGKCIATWPVGRDESQAKYKISKSYTNKKFNDGAIATYKWVVSGIGENRALGEYFAFALYPYRIHGDPSSTYRRDLKSCSGGTVGGRLMAKVLIPKIQNEGGRR